MNHIKLGIKPVFIGVICKKEAQKRNHEIVKYLEQNLTDEVGKVLTRLLGNYLTEALGKVLDIYTFIIYGVLSVLEDCGPSSKHCAIIVRRCTSVIQVQRA